ncbi:MAG TPA: helix-turn-helix domain-containing protein [Candidatus Dormibacteraeota bacterium]|nr:helix-turn-helix domain-containing protein [Candidatus Dormibacteraeota bacterium]
MGEFLTTGEAAALLGVSKPTIVRAIQRGQLRPALVTPGLHRRFRREDLLAFRISALSFPAPAPAAPAIAVELTGRAAQPAVSSHEVHVPILRAV